MKDGHDSIDHALDAALEMTFPASDPIAVFMQDYDGWNDARAGGQRTARASAAMSNSKGVSVSLPTRL